MITVHSVEGVGTEFSFALPAQVAAESRRQEPLPIDLAGARIVVIDDHEQTRTILCDNIGGWGFDCVGASDALTGYSIIRAASESGLPVDAIVVDETMPGESGCDLVERLRAEPAFACLPVIMAGVWRTRERRARRLDPRRRLSDQAGAHADPPGDAGGRDQGATAGRQRLAVFLDAVEAPDSGECGRTCW